MWGPVFRAFDPDRDRLVAVKLFKVDLPAERLHQLVDELEWLLAAELTHPAIAAGLATGICGNHAYLAQEYVAADSLDVAVREYGPAPPADVLRVAAQLAGALDFAAVVEVGHGALHPRDVLLSPEDTRLTGLGIARAFERIGVALPVRHPYTPPERIAGEWDRRADIFSLAALMREMLWGRRPPATGAAAAESLTEIAGGDLDALRVLFTRALAENPADRFETALEFAQALTQAFPDITAGRPQVPAYGNHSTGPVIGERGPGSDPAPCLPLGEPLVLVVEPELAPEGVEEFSLAPASPTPGKASTMSTVPAVPTVTVASPAPIADDLTLREAAPAGHDDVELAPSIVAAPSKAVESHGPVGAPAAPISGYPVDVPISALERSRSAVWPLVLALIVGAAIGFAGGYDVGSHDRPSLASTVAQQEAGREWTEGAANEPGKTPPPAAPALAPAGASAARRDPAGTLQAARPGAGPPRASKTAATEGNGRLLVRSTPAGARVFVDGREQGKTPLAIRELSLGPHRVRLVREGYETEEQRISISASRPAQSVTLPMSRVRAAESRTPAPPVPGPVARFVGALTVESRPPGASVFVDGKLVGTTPIQLPSLNAGSHAVRLEHDGYRRWSSSVRVVASERNRVTASLEK